jgi:CRISPR-associated protein Cas2
MTVIVVARVTPALRGTLSRWMIQVQAGVFVGKLSRPVRDRLWNTILGLKRLGRSVMVTRDRTEQGFSIVAAGDDRRAVADFDGLTLIKTFAPLSATRGCRKLSGGRLRRGPVCKRARRGSNVTGRPATP